MSIVLIIILVFLVLLLSALFIIYNTLVQLRNKVDEAFSTMDVCLKKRFDLIPSLVEVTKGYARHESSVLEDIARRRSGIPAGDINGQLPAEAGISQALKQIFVVAEAYPDLKANTTFLTLQEQLVKMEDEISLSRRYYNGSVRQYNNKCQQFPTNIVAGMMGFRTRPMFAVGSEEERRAVNINL
ncbi:MAG: LemA family protein [Prevotella sp.]|nr:LemA family protein [Prevotella sp.]